MAAPVVIGLGLFGFGDAGSMARLALGREAEFASETLVARWPGPGAPLPIVKGDDLAGGRQISADGPLDTTLGAAPAGTGTGTGAGPDPDSASPDPIQPLLRLAALDAAAAGRRSLALDQLDNFDKAGADPGSSLLARVQVLRLLGDEPAGIDDLWPTDAPFTPGPKGIPARLAAFLASAPLLSPEKRGLEAQAVRAAIVSGQVGLAPPEDVLHVHGGDAGSGSVEFVPDALWTALEELAEELAPGPDWSSAFLVDDRRQAALNRWAWNELDQGQRQWRLRPLGAHPWLAVAADASGHWRAQACTPGALDQMLASLVPGLPAGARVAAFTDTASDSAITEAKPLPGLDRPFRIVHEDPGSVARAAVIRQTALRGGLIGAGLLMAFAALLMARTLSEADRVAALRSTFVASVSHDLRTPIASIGLLAETLREGHAQGRENHYARSIEQEAGRLRRIVDDLLDFGRLERGLPVRITKRDVDVPAWVQSFAAREGQRCQTFGSATLALETVNLPDTARLDVEAVERALSNLIDNALKHSGADRITLSVRGAAAGREELTFEVVDGGTGLTRAALHEGLFEPFARDSVASGTGLGLSIVRAIAAAHGGNATLLPGAAGRGLVARVTVSTTPEAA